MHRIAWHISVEHIVALCISPRLLDTYTGTEKLRLNTLKGIHTQLRLMLCTEPSVSADRATSP